MIDWECRPMGEISNIQLQNSGGCTFGLLYQNVY
jgi:hypothetical protein